MNDTSKKLLQCLIKVIEQSEITPQVLDICEDILRQIDMSECPVHFDRPILNDPTYSPQTTTLSVCITNSTTTTTIPTQFWSEFPSKGHDLKTGEIRKEGN